MVSQLASTKAFSAQNFYQTGVKTFPRNTQLQWAEHQPPNVKCKIQNLSEINNTIIVALKNINQGEKYWKI